MTKQSGFTLVESAISVALAVIVATGVGSAVNYTFKANNKVNNTLPAINSIQVAGRWASQDIQIANRTSLVDGALPVDPAITPVSFYRTDYYSDTPLSHTITYTLSNGELQRNYDGQIITVARNISSGVFSRAGRVITVVVNSSGQNRTYQIFMRSG